MQICLLPLEYVQQHLFDNNYNECCVWSYLFCDYSANKSNILLYLTGFYYFLGIKAVILQEMGITSPFNSILSIVYAWELHSRFSPTPTFQTNQHYSQQADQYEGRLHPPT